MDLEGLTASLGFLERSDDLDGGGDVLVDLDR